MACYPELRHIARAGHPRRQAAAEADENQRVLPDRARVQDYYARAEVSVSTKHRQVVHLVLERKLRPLAIHQPDIHDEHAFCPLRT